MAAKLIVAFRLLPGKVSRVKALWAPLFLPARLQKLAGESS